ncbi:MAG TPA: Calx-beta domain-containing protein, partial [Verrucomicrobiae bacterium]|nr:Calx-beta domain-containing protein [Verrucomicrobiae bacterium]
MDTTFNATGANGTVYAVQVYSTNDVLNGGKILIGGDFTMVNGSPRNHIARLNADGTLDAGFNPGAGPNGSVRAIAIQVDGNVLIGGIFTSVAGNPLNYIARLTPNGSVDPVFTPGVGANDAVTCIAIQEDQKIVLGGVFTQASGVTRNRLTRLNPDGTVDPGINFGTGANGFVSTLVIQPDDELLIGGGFTQFNNQNTPYIARLYGRNGSGSGSLEFVSTNFQASQNGTNAVISVRRDGATGDPAIGNVYVTFSTGNFTAVAGVDYVGVTNTLTFPVGETFQTVTVPIINNSSNGVVAANKIANLTLSNPTDAALGLQPVATLTIVNINSSIGFSTPAYHVNKNAANGAAVISVTRGGGAIGVASVDFITTTNGTGIPGVDYIPTTNTVNFADGQSNATVSVPVINNGLVEGNTTVGMMLLNPTNVVLLPQTAAATLTIVDNGLAAGGFMFSATNYSVLETGTNAVITVVRTNGSVGQISVNYAASGGTATPGTDYALTNGSLTFLEGDLSKTFVVPVFNDLNLASNVTVNLTLSNPTGGSQIIGPATVPLTIVNQNIDLNFSQFGYFVDETNGPVTIGVNRTGNTNVAVSVYYTTTNGTAFAGTNYTTTSGILNFGVGETFQTFTIPIIYNPQITGNLLFFVNLYNPSSPGQLISPISAQVTINDDDTGLEFASATNSVSKANTNIVISVLRLGNTLGASSVDFNTLGGTALAGIEFAPTNGTLNFPAGISSNSFTL